MAAVFCLLLLLLLLGWLRRGGDAAVVARCSAPEEAFNRTCSCGPSPVLCLRKCCPLDQVMYAANKTCRTANATDQLEAQLEESATNLSVAASNGRVGWRCPCGAYSLSHGRDNFTILANASLEIRGGENFVVTTSFCLDSLVRHDGVVVFFALVCFEKCNIVAQAGVIQRTSHLVKYWSMLVSVPFYAATLFVYAAVPRLRNLHGKTLMCYVASLFTAYSLLPTLGLLGIISGPFCITSAFIIYFAFLASFFWLNVMCLDIWWTFSGFRSMRGSVKEREHKKFIIYSLYCWGCPLIMLIICIIMDLHPGIPETYAKPGFGEVKCWFRSTAGNLIYFSGPIAVLIVCNIVLFILTATKIRQVKRGTKILKKQDSRRHNEEEENNAQRFNLYLKLFLVMGVTWIMEVISFAAGGPDEWWYVTDIANTLQGVLIFIIFVWKHRIRRLLMERFCPSRAATSHSVASSSTRMTVMRRNGSVMSSGRSSLRAQEGHPMKSLTASPSVRSDDSDVA